MLNHGPLFFGVLQKSKRPPKRKKQRLLPKSDRQRAKWHPCFRAKFQIKMDVIQNPLLFVDKWIQENAEALPHQDSDISGWGIRQWFEEQLNDELVQSMPSVGQSPPKTLVKYVGMVQDMFDPEFYVALHKKNSGLKKVLLYLFTRLSLCMEQNLDFFQVFIEKHLKKKSLLRRIYFLLLGQLALKDKVFCVFQFLEQQNGFTNFKFHRWKYLSSPQILRKDPQIGIQTKMK